MGRTGSCDGLIAFGTHGGGNSKEPVARYSSACDIARHSRKRPAAAECGVVPSSRYGADIFPSGTHTGTAGERLHTYSMAALFSCVAG